MKGGPPLIEAVTIIGVRVIIGVFVGTVSEAVLSGAVVGVVFAGFPVVLAVEAEAFVTEEAGLSGGGG
jgi:hypothetical protein